MASLAGKADPIITRMAYAASMANVPGDYSEYYQSTVDAHKELMGGIEEMAATFKLENDIATLEFKKAMSVFNDPLNVQMIDSDYTEMQADITAQREEWKANKGFKNDPEGRQDWDRRNNQIIGRHEQDNANLATIQTGVEGNLYDIENMEIGKKKFLTNLAKYQANQNGESGKHNADATRYMKNNPNATSEDLWKNLGELEEGVVVKYKDPKTGEYTYISKVGETDNKKPIIESQKSSELLDYAPTRADGTLVKMKDKFQDSLTRANGTELGYSGFRNQDRNDLEEILDTDALDNPNTLKYMTNQKIGGEKLSFAEALRSGKALGLTNDIIVALGATKSDGDNILEESDFLDPNNYNTVVNSILSGTATYDEGGKPKSVDTKGLYLDYTMDNAFKTGHNQYKKKKSGVVVRDGKGGRYAQGKTVRAEGIGEYIAHSTAEIMYDAFGVAGKGTDTSFTLAKTKYTYDSKNDNWSDGETDYGNSDKFRQSLGINDPDFIDITSTASVIDEESEKVVIKKDVQKYGVLDWDKDGTTNINIDTVGDADEEVATRLNNQMPTGDLNPMGYNWSTDGSWRNEVFLLDASGDRIDWDVIDPNKTLRKKYGVEHFVSGLEKFGGNVLIRTNHDNLKDKRENMNLLLDILKRIRYTTTDGTTTLYDNFQPLSATSGGATSDVDTSGY